MSLTMYSSTTSVVLISLALFVGWTTVAAQSSRQDQRPILWRALENALVNSDEMLYNLSTTFFPPKSWDNPRQDVYNCVTLSVLVSVTVDKISDPSFTPYFANDSAGLCCSTNMGYCSVWVNCNEITVTLQQPRVDRGTQQLSKLLGGPEINMVLSTFDPAFYYLMKKLSDESLGFVQLLDFQTIILVNFNVQELGVMPSESELYESISAVLTWAKAYARAHGRPHEWHDRDRYAVVPPEESVDMENDDTMLISRSSTSLLLMCAFLFANLLVLMVVLMFFGDTFLWLQSSNESRTIYVASGVVLALLNHITFVFEIILINQFISKPEISVYYIAVKLPLMVIVFAIEIIVVSYNTYRHLPMNCLRWIGHSFVSCHILWFVHRLVTDTIISITSFIVAPAQTLGVLTLILSTVACLIFFVAYLFNKAIDGCNRRTCLPMLSAIIIGITTCGLVSIFTLLFIALVDNGLKSSGIGGFILSLIPPSLIFLAGIVAELNLSVKYLPHYSSRSNVSIREKCSKRSRSERKISSRHKAHLLSAVSVQVSDDENNFKESGITVSSNTINETTPLTQ